MIDLIQEPVKGLHDGIVLQVRKVRLCLAGHCPCLICIERMVCNQILLLSSHVEVLGKEVIMRAQDNLDALAGELQQSFHQHVEEIWIEICLWLIPE